MNYVVEKEDGFTIIGPKINVSLTNNENFVKIPMFWEETMRNGSFNNLEGHIGEKGVMGVCADFDQNSQTFDYYIAIEKPDVELKYPELTIEAGRWVKFKGYGVIPHDFQKMVKGIPKWFEEHPEFVRVNKPELELYSPIQDEKGNCGFEIWIAIK